MLMFDLLMYFLNRALSHVSGGPALIQSVRSLQLASERNQLMHMITLEM